MACFWGQKFDCFLCRFECGTISARFAQKIDPGALGGAPPDAGPKVGQDAPEIQGADLDGAPFKLSDYRGKVVMLAFWGDW